MNELFATVQAWDIAGLSSAEAILAGVQHSSPRPAGARLVVNEKGEVAGAVSMGCVENDLREHLLALLRGEGTPRMVHYGRAFAESLEVGLSCGGEIDVWLRRHEPQSETWQQLRALASADRAILLTRLTPDSSQILLRPGTPPPAGWTTACDELWTRGGVRKIALGTELWLAEAIAPAPRLFIVGASPLSAALADLASRTGFIVWVLDPRRDFARAELFPAGTTVLHRWPEEGFAEASLDEHSFVAVLAHDPKLDVPALATALRTRCKYVGLLGSSSTQAARRAALLDAGVSPADIARIHGPIGIKSIGALEPTEIAVAILAELIMARRQIG